jgi:hypothetical protein
MGRESHEGEGPLRRWWMTLAPLVPMALGLGLAALADASLWAGAVVGAALAFMTWTWLVVIAGPASAKRRRDWDDRRWYDPAGEFARYASLRQRAIEVAGKLRPERGRGRSRGEAAKAGAELGGLSRAAEALRKLIDELQRIAMATPEDVRRAERAAAGLPPGPLRSARRAEVRAAAQRLRAAGRLPEHETALLADLTSAIARLERIAKRANHATDAASLREEREACQATAAALQARIEALTTDDTDTNAGLRRRLRRAALGSAHCVAALLVIWALGLLSPWWTLLAALVLVLAGIVPVLATLGLAALPVYGCVLVSGVVIFISGPQLYHAAFGDSTLAVVVDSDVVEYRGRETDSRHYRIEEAGTGRDLGELRRGPRDEALVGDRVEVSLDPLDWAQPVAAQRLGWIAVPLTVIGGLVAVIVLLPQALLLRGARERRA